MSQEKFRQIFTRCGAAQKGVYVIAEISANHGGSLEKAIEIVHAAKAAGADCVKTQVYRPDTITVESDAPLYQVSRGAWAGETLFSLYEKAQTPWEWNAVLKKEAEKLGLEFTATPFDETAVALLEELDIGFYKVASAEIVHLPLLKTIAETGKPIILSTGMASLAEVEEAVQTIRDAGNDAICLLKCSSTYPAPFEHLHLKTIPHLSETFGVPAGFSDHSAGAVSAVLAVGLGARVIEKHLCISNEDETADAFFSLDQADFAAMVRDVRLAEQALGKVCYTLADSERGNVVYRRSILVVQAIAAGEVLRPEHVRIARPAAGIKPKYYDRVLGATVKRALSPGDPLQWQDLELNG